MIKFGRNKNGHDALDGHWMRIFASIRALKHINHLSEKQRPVFQQLEEDITNFEKEYASHKNETSHYDTYDLVIVIGKWVGGLLLFAAATKSLWMPWLK